MRLFKKVQARKKTEVFVSKLKNGEVKEPKKIAKKKKVPRFLTRGIILKIKKNQSICSTLAFASVAFIFYQNKSKNKSKENTAEKITSSLFFAPEVKDQEDKYNKNVSYLKEHRLFFPNNYIINTQPTQVLQKKTTLITIFYNTFLEIKPFFNILQKFTSLLLKKNVYLVREMYPFIYTSLRGASTISGFKKVLYNKVLVQDRRLKPAYNRRKHNTSHYMVIQNQFARLNKAFVYLGKNKLASMVGFVLKAAYSRTLPAFGWVNTKKRNYFNNKRSIRPKAVPSLVSVIEGQTTLLLWRNQFYSSLTKSRQKHKQGVSQNLNVVCKNNVTILLK